VPQAHPGAERPWWRAERDRLLALVEDGEPRYVYHLETVVARARMLRQSLRSVSRFYYAMKANAHAEILRALAREGFGIECVSLAEVRHARSVVGPDVALMFTPSFCPIAEYREALALGAELIVDGTEAIAAAPTTFRSRAVGLRIDPGFGRGHHEKVRTAGGEAKFGCTIDDAIAVREAVASLGGRIVGLHAHVGSGILDPGAWTDSARALIDLLPAFPDLTWLDPGGGLGVPSRPGQAPLDLERVERGLSGLRQTLGTLALRLEPGRYLVSEAGVLVSPVTQVRTKRGVRFAGLAVGMNALIRPALYGAWHGIHNLTRSEEASVGPWHVVGPICETADVLGRDRELPETRPGDVLLIENVGAYGVTMASSYNLRPPPREVVLT
jgi:bifunctional diaminopimelate decarboxylase / aspartate kinase